MRPWLLVLTLSAPLFLLACRGVIAGEGSKSDTQTDAGTDATSGGGGGGTGGACTPAPACVSASSLSALHTFSTKADADTALTGDWTVCPDSPPIDGYPFATYGDDPPVPAIFSLGTTYDGKAIQIQNALVDGDDGTYTMQYDECSEALLLTSQKDPSLTIVLARGKAPASPPPPQGCSLLGTFEESSPSNTRTASFLFNADGTFVGGATGAKLPAQATFSGTFAASSDEVEILGSTGMQCDASAAAPISWDSSCTHATISDHYDDCTGGRWYFGGGGETDLVRR